MTTLYFDICETLGTVEAVLDKDSDDIIVEKIHPLPYIKQVLSYQSASGINLGIISNSGEKYVAYVNQALEKSGLAEFFKNQNLLIYSGKRGLERNTSDIFELAIERSGEEAADCIFVGEDGFERKIAEQLGMRVCPHPIMAQSAINDEKLNYVSIDLKPQSESEEVKFYSSALVSVPLVPLLATGRNGRKLIAIGTEAGQKLLSSPQIDVRNLPSRADPSVSDLFLVRRDPAIEEWGKFLSKVQPWIVDVTNDGVLIALPGGELIDDYHPDNARHGHTQKLILGDEFVSPYKFFQSPTDVAPQKENEEGSILSEDHANLLLSQIDAKAIAKHLNSYSPDDESRHVRHRGKREAVGRAVRDFDRIGEGKFTVRVYPFKMDWRLLCNVEAELAGDTEEAVIVSAHLDSTAKSSYVGTRKISPAPGADDDGSGVAGVLAISEAIKKLATEGKPKRNIRFLLFNAEEQGLVGSQKYAKYQFDRKEQIIGVFQMDMIGYNKDNVPHWELHIGCLPYPRVQERSRELVELIKRLRPLVSKELYEPQLFESYFYFHHDPAEGRSDHSPFHRRGYAACLACEDFFAGPRISDPIAETNPNYHTQDDKISNVNTAFAASIARLIGAAAWRMANR